MSLPSEPKAIDPSPTWDPYLRTFHWALATFFTLAYALQGGWPQLHSHAGYTVALLLLFRLTWGWLGPEHARFEDFVVPPMAGLRHLRALAAGRAPRFQGHDPAGACMIVALLFMLSVTALSGAILFAMEGSGPLAGAPVAGLPGGALEMTHSVAADVTLALAVLHIGGVLTTSLVHRENLVGAMIHGIKRAAAEPSPTSGSDG